MTTTTTLLLLLLCSLAAAQPATEREQAYQMVIASTRANDCATAKIHFDKYLALATAPASDEARRGLAEYVSVCETSAPTDWRGVAKPSPPPQPPRQIFPLQVDAVVEAHSGDQQRVGMQLTASYVRPFALLSDNRTVLFGGVGPAVRFYRWDFFDFERGMPATVQGAAPGIELRAGVAFGSRLGAPRLTLGVTPTWTHGVATGDRPGGTGLGIRGGLGFAWPRLFVGWARGSATGESGFAWLGVAAAALLPTHVEYVVDHVPGSTTHAAAFGYSF